MIPVSTDKTIVIRGKVDCIMADNMEFGIEQDRRALIPGNAVLLNGVRYLIHKREPLLPQPGKRAWFWLVRDMRTRHQRLAAKAQRRNHHG